MQGACTRDSTRNKTASLHNSGRNVSSPVNATLACISTDQFYQNHCVKVGQHPPKAHVHAPLFL
jgi:hypothetical protein